MGYIIKYRYLSAVILVFISAPVLAKELYSLTDVEYGGKHDTVSNETRAVYDLGVRMGIINSNKYTLESFEKDKENIFKELYDEYITLNISPPTNYYKSLVTNNFGIPPDTQDSLFAKKITKRSTSSDYKKAFVNTVKKGDILITGKNGKQGAIGNIGHAAIMMSDYWVLEMFGGAGWNTGIPDNNLRISKYDWFDKHALNWTTVYRCPDNDVAVEAAQWAHYAYYNHFGGNEKTRHITYLITDDFFTTNPSYCGKLVMQAYYHSSGKKNVTRKISEKEVVIPIDIHSYFLYPYRLINKGRY